MRFIPRFSITNAIAAPLTEIERARRFLDAASLSDEWIDSMRSRAFLLEAHHTTHIEGTRLTIEEAADLLAGDDVPGADPEDSSGPHHQDSGEAKIRESTAGVSRKPSSDGKARGSSSKDLSGLTAWNTRPGDR